MTTNPDPSGAASAPTRNEINRATARKTRRNKFIRKAIELGHVKDEHEGAALFASREIEREAYIAARLIENPGWNRERAATGWCPHGVRLNSSGNPVDQYVTEDNGWFVSYRTYGFQRQLWLLYGIVLAFGEYRRLIRQVSVTGDREARRPNYQRRLAQATLDNGFVIDIFVQADRIIGLADTMVPFGPYTPRQVMFFNKALHRKYGILLRPEQFSDIHQQIGADSEPVLTFANGRGIYRITVGDDDEVYVMVGNGRIIEPKKREGVRKGIAARANGTLLLKPLSLGGKDKAAEQTQEA